MKFSGHLLAGLSLLFFIFSLSAQPIISIQPTSQTVVWGGTATFSVAVTGVGPFNYQWQWNGTNLPNNIITTVAGNGSANYSGDGGLAVNASLYYPQGVAFDAAGNLYIADNNNDRVRKVDLNGIITTVAGNGVGSSTNGGSFPAMVARQPTLDYIGLIIWPLIRRAICISPTFSIIASVKWILMV